MTTQEAALLDQYRHEQATHWGREAAECDNELMAGTWRQCNVQHRQAVMREIDSLPDNEVGREVRRLFASAYDAAIDFSIAPGREASNMTSTKFIVLCDDGTGRNSGHHYATCRTRRQAEQKAHKAEATLPWCVGAWVEEVPSDYIHDSRGKR
jgi:hypothetical protein